MPQTPNVDAVVDDEIIEVAWGNSVADMFGNMASLPLGSGNGSVANRLYDITAQKVGPFAGGGVVDGSFPLDAPIQMRGGQLGITTNSVGYAGVNFQTAFPNGVWSVVVTPYIPVLVPSGGLAATFFPHVASMNRLGFAMFAMAPQSWPYATAHPPSTPDMWTMASVTLTLTYVAIGC